MRRCTCHAMSARMRHLPATPVVSNMHQTAAAAYRPPRAMTKFSILNSPRLDVPPRAACTLGTPIRAMPAARALAALLLGACGLMERPQAGAPGSTPAAGALAGLPCAAPCAARLRLRGGGGDAGDDEIGKEVRSIFSQARPNSSWQAATASQVRVRVRVRVRACWSGGETRSERAVLACACASTVLCDRAARSQGSGDSSETESADDDDAGAAAAGFQPFDRSSRMWQMLDQLEREETTALEARARKREQQQARREEHLAGAFGSRLQREFALDLGMSPDAPSVCAFSVL